MTFRHPIPLELMIYWRAWRSELGLVASGSPVASVPPMGHRGVCVFTRPKTSIQL